MNMIREYIEIKRRIRHLLIDLEAFREGLLYSYNRAHVSDTERLVEEGLEKFRFVDFAREKEERDTRPDQ